MTRLVAPANAPAWLPEYTRSIERALRAQTGAGTGTVTSVAGTGTVSGITLTGTVTSSGSLTLGGTLAATSANISDFSEAVDDRVASLMVAGNGVSITYNDAGNALTVAAVTHYIYQNGDYTLNNVGTSQRIFGQTTNGQFTFPQTGIYQFECQLIIDTMSASSGNARFELLGAGTATLSGQLFHVIGIDATTPTNAGTQTGSGARAGNNSPASMVSGGTGTAMLVTIRGIFRCTAVGTLIPSLTLVNAAAAVVKAGSYLAIRRLGDDTAYSTSGWD